MSLHRYSQLVTAATFILLIAGGLVTSTDSGLSVPDWPLSYGQYFPPMIGGIRFEHTHRVIAGLVGLLTLALALFFLRKEERGWVQGIGVTALIMVVAQAVLGGLTVIYLLPAPISVLHACLGQTFFCTLAALALFTSTEWRETAPLSAESLPSLKRLLALTTALIYLQLVAGAIVRHTQGLGTGYHVLFAFLIVFHVLFAVLKIAKDPVLQPRLFPHAVFLGGLIVAQIFLGLGAFIMTQMLPKAEMPRTGEVLFATAHQATGALILAVSLLLTLRSFRLFKPAVEQGS